MLRYLMISKCLPGGESIRVSRHPKREEGIAALVALIALSIFSLLGLSMVMNTTTEVKVSDNYESQIQANNAAQAGLNHARELLRGPKFDYHLPGPDGAASSETTYLTIARTHAFRNPISWADARALNVLDPTTDLAGYNDDGLLNAGPTSQISLIPLTGIAVTAPDPYGYKQSVDGTITTGRYFVKVTDNSGEASELAADPSDNPFTDGDHIVVVRSMGVARTFREGTGAAARSNSVTVYEARFKQRYTFDLDAPFVIQGDDVLPSGPKMWDGAAFRINGGNSNYGIATIDTNPHNGIFPSDQIKAPLDKNQEKNITGMGQSPSVVDITGSVQASADQSMLLDPSYLWNLVNNVLPQYADNYYQGDQHWAGNPPEDLGTYNPALPDDHPSQNAKVTIVDGDLEMGGNISGGGLLVVTGKIKGNGTMTWAGLVLVIGKGDVDGSGLNIGIDGGIYICNVVDNGDGTYDFGTPKFTWRGNSNVRMHGEAIRSSMRMLPLEQLSFREITSLTDP